MSTDRWHSRKDPCWKHFRNPKNTRIAICKYCGQSRVGLFRAKRHIVGDFVGVKSCEKAPDHVKEEVRNYISPQIGGKKRFKELIMIEKQIKQQNSIQESSSEDQYDDENDAQVDRSYRYSSQKSKIKKRLKGQSSDERIENEEVGILPIEFKSSAIPADDDDDSLVNVNGYRVQSTNAPILKAIFAKYGDITSHCVYKSTSFRASVLDFICNLVRKLRGYENEAVLSNLDSITIQVSDIQASKIDVSWLNEHLAQVCKAAVLMQLKKTKPEIGLLVKEATKEMICKHTKLLQAQKDFEDAERCAKVLEIVSRKIDRDILECGVGEHPLKVGFHDLL